MMNNRGFTLLELIIVITILGVLAIIAVPRLIGYSDVTVEAVCDTNCKDIEKLYEGWLAMDDIHHSDMIFEEFLNGYYSGKCPGGGVYSYVEGEVKCNVHVKPAVEEDMNEVPFL